MSTAYTNPISKIYKFQIFKYTTVRVQSSVRVQLACDPRPCTNWKIFFLKTRAQLYCVKISLFYVYLYIESYGLPSDTKVSIL